MTLGARVFWTQNYLKKTNNKKVPNHDKAWTQILAI